MEILDEPIINLGQNVTQPLRLLIVDDSKSDAELLLRTLHTGGFEAAYEVVDSSAAMRAALERQEWDVITSDHAMPQFSGPAALALAQELRPGVPFIIVSGEIDLNLAVSLIKWGAQDYVQKAELAKLVPVMKRVLHDAEARRKQESGEQALQVSETRYRRLFETAQDGILIVDADTGQIDDVNPFLMDLVGFSRKEYLGKKLWEIGAFKDSEASKSAFLELQSKGYIRYENIPLHTCSGGSVDVEFVSNVYVVDHKRVIQCNIRDITERRQAEAEVIKLNAELEQRVQALQVSETRYRRLFETAQDGILIVDADTGQIDDVNPFLMDLVGFSRKEYLGKKLWEIGAFKDSEASKSAFLELQSKGYIRYENIPLHTCSGGSVDVEFVSNVYVVDHKRVIQCNIRDITERRQAEAEVIKLNAELEQRVQALQVSETRYRRLFETAQDGILIVDADTGQIDDVNPFLMDLVGFSRKEYLGKKLWEIGAFKDSEASKSAFLELQSKGYIRYENIPLHTCSGGSVDVEFVSNVYVVDHKRVIQCNIRDITERRQAEAEVIKLNAELEQRVQALQVSETRYRRLFETAQDGILIVDADTGQIDDVNPFLMDLVGFSRKEYLGKKLWEIGAFKDSEASKSAFLELQSKGYIRYENIPLHTCSGGSVDVEFVSNVYVVDHKRVIQCNIRDITERRQAEAEVIKLNAELEQRVQVRTAQVEALNKELGTFNYSVSHDLRAPLRRIAGFVKALEEDCAGKLDSEGRRLIQNILASTQHMTSLIEALLKLASVSSGKLQLKPTNLSSMSRVIAAELQQADPSRHVEFVIAEDITAAGDASLLRVVMENLLANAWKFTSHRDSARIEFGVAPQTDKPEAYFVRDNGAGFDMKYAAKLFGAFQRLHAENEFSGTGIGLASVQRIIHRHGGRIWAKSAVGQGTTFYFVLETVLKHHASSAGSHAA